MKGARELFTCEKCGKAFFYWVLDGNATPKVKCYYCSHEFFPRGEPAPAPAPPAPAAAPPAKEVPAAATAPAPVPTTVS